MKDHIAGVDPTAYANLKNPSRTIGGNPIGESNLELISDSLTRGDDDPIARQIRQYFESKDFSREDYEKVRKELGDSGPNQPIGNLKWGGLDHYQRLGVGHYMAYKGLLFA